MKQRYLALKERGKYSGQGIYRFRKLDDSTCIRNDFYVGQIMKITCYTMSLNRNFAFLMYKSSMNGMFQVSEILLNLEIW